MARRPSQRQLFRELAAKFGLEVAEAFMAAVRDLTSEVELQKVILALERRDLEAAMAALHIDRAAFVPLEQKLREAFVSGGQGAAASMSPSVSIGFRFDPGNQRAAEIIRARGADLIDGLTDQNRAAAREILADGMARGAHPRTVALDLVGRENRATGRREGGLIGLSKPQRDHVAAARAELASSDPKTLAHYLTRTRRDRRYDHLVRKAIKDGTRVEAGAARMMVTAYSSRLLKLRGEVIARTEALPAIRAAKREAYQQLVDDGRVEAMDLVRGWVVTKDGRQRDTHDAMGGQEVRGLDAPFVSPSGAMLLYPGDTSMGAGTEEVVSCRCDEFIAIRKRWPI